MAVFAELDANNVVLRVISVSNDVLMDEQGNEVEQKGIDYCHSRLGGIWIQTSKNTFGNRHLEGRIPFRKNYAGIGFTYDPQRDAFIAPQPEGNFVFDEETCVWVCLDLPENEIGVSRV